MGYGSRAWLLAGGVAALAASLGSVCWIGLQRPADASVVQSGALAVVLLPRADGSRLAVVDLANARVVRRIELRSLATDIAVDTSSGVVVGAQAGGFGPAIDRAASLTDVRTGTVRYVDLPVVDPGDVACVDGRALLLHSTLKASGTAFTVVDVASGRVTGSGNIPGPPGLWASAAGAVWSTGEDSTGRPSLRRVDPRSLSVSAFGLGGFLPTGLVEAGGRPLGVGMDTRAGSPRAARRSQSIRKTGPRSSGGRSWDSPAAPAGPLRSGGGWSSATGAVTGRRAGPCASSRPRPCTISVP